MNKSEFRKTVRELNLRTYASLGQSRQFAEEALEMAQNKEDTSAIFECCVYLATYHISRREIISAKSFLSRAWDLHKGLCNEDVDNFVLSQLHTSTGIIADDEADYPKSLSHHHASLRLARETGDLRGEQRALSNIGYACYKLGDGTQAIKHLGASLRHSTDPRFISNTHEIMAETYEIEEQWEYAIQHRQKGLAALGDNFPFVRLRLLMDLAITCVRANKHSEGIALYTTLLNQLHMSMPDRDADRMLLVRGELAVFEGRLGEAYDLAQQAQAAFLQTGDIQRCHESQLLSSRIENLRGNWQAALDQLQYLERQSIAFHTRRRLQRLQLTIYRKQEMWHEAVMLMEDMQELQFVESLRTDLLYTLQKEADKAEQMQRSNQMLQEAYDKLEYLYREKDELLRIVAHDLKNPLAGILLTTETLLKYQSQFTEQQREEKQKRILATINRMLAVVNQLEAAAKAETRSPASEETAYLLGEFVAGLVSEHSDQASAKGQHIHLNQPDLMISVTINQLYLHQILANLLSNAIKYSPHNTDIQLNTKLTRHHQVAIQVIDQGPGFSKQDRAQLFQKYARLSAKPTGNESSTGLGLYIVKQLVKALGGSIQLEAVNQGQGSCFTVAIPLANGEHLKDGNPP